MQSDDELIEVEPLASDVYESMKGANCKQKEREELELLTKQFLRKGKIHELPPSQERAESLRF